MPQNNKKMPTLRLPSGDFELTVDRKGNIVRVSDNGQPGTIIEVSAKELEQIAAASVFARSLPKAPKFPEDTNNSHEVVVIGLNERGTDFEGSDDPKGTVYIGCQQVPPALVQKALAVSRLARHKATRS